MDSPVFQFSLPGVLDVRVFGSIEGRVERYRERIKAADDDPAEVLYSASQSGKWMFWKRQESGLVREIKSAPVFFETTYQVRCTFKDEANVTDAFVFHEMESVADEFYFDNRLLDGRLDFVNSPGLFSFEIDYVSHGKPQRLKLKWWVVSEKIDVQSDLKEIKKKIDEESKGFVYEFLSKTKGPAGLAARRSDTEGEWLDIFKGIFEPYRQAVAWIVQSPHLRYQPKVRYERADKIKRWSPLMANLFSTFDKSQKERYQFRVEQVEPIVDTPENRFVLFTLKKISEKLSILEARCRRASGVADKYAEQVHLWKAELDRLKAKPFFRSIGRFNGLKQENLVLQRKRGYARIYESWVALQHAIDITKRGFEAGNKPVWKLYEFWCYLVIRDYIQSVETEDGKGKRYKIDEGKSGLGSLLRISDVFEDYDPETPGNGSGKSNKGGSKCEYVFDDQLENRTITLTYQQSYSNAKGVDVDGKASAHIVEQIPDIVMTIKENDGEQNSYTYLFDAKYQIMSLPSTSNPEIDAAPYKTINEMHRYRDAILYRRAKLGGEVRGRLTHEVIGAYVLYPGQADKAFEYKDFILEENIGAIPLLPGQNGVRRLHEYLDLFLGRPTKRAHLCNAIPPRGADILLSTTPFQVVEWQSGSLTDAINKCGWCLCSKDKCANPDVVDYLVVPHTRGAHVYQVDHAVPRKELTVKDIQSFEQSAFQNIKFSAAATGFWAWKVIEVSK